MRKTISIAFAGLLLAGNADASCGAAFCASTNDWLSLTQGVTQGWRIWGQTEYIDQNQLMAGSKKISRDEISEGHVETKTINRNFLLGMEYGFANEWSVGVALPYSNREHSHVHESEVESWGFDGLGDMRVNLRYQPNNQHGSELKWSLNGGLKLPTGKTDVRNADGEKAEHSVQPGTGTTDLLLGGGLAYAPLGLPGNLFANLSAQLPLYEKDGYQPGWRTTLQAGWQYPVSGKVDFLLQANFAKIGRDRGANAESDETGRTEVSIVPGVAYAWSKKLMFNARIELPVYHKVTGVQLAHDYALLGGVSLTLD